MPIDDVVVQEEGLSTEDINDLMDVSDTPEEPIEEGPVSDAEVEGRTSTPPTPVALPAPSVTPTPVEPPQPPAAAVVPTPTPEPVVSPPPTPVDMGTSTGTPSQAPTVEEIHAQREALVNEISSRYSVSDEDKDLLQTEPEKVLPKFAGRLFADVYDAVFQTVYAQIPSLVASYNRGQKAATDYQDQFYQRWPGLDKTQHDGVVVRLARAYVNANPRASREQVIESVGAWAHVQLGIPPSGLQAPAPPPPPARPPTPVGIGASVPGPGAAQGNPNFWDELIHEDLEV